GVAYRLSSTGRLSVPSGSAGPQPRTRMRKSRPRERMRWRTAVPRHNRALLSVVLSIVALGWQVSRTTLASPASSSVRVDLASEAGASLMQGQWRYSDVRIIDTSFPTADAEGQPTGYPAATHDISPHAGAVGFDDSAWEVIAPDSLARRRGAGRVSFNWYRI